MSIPNPTAVVNKNRRLTTRDRILHLLAAASPGWVPAPALSKIACAYTRCVHELRELGYVVENKIEVVDGQKHGSYRLMRRDPERSAHVEFWQGPSPLVPSSPVQSGLLDLGARPAASVWVDPEQGGRRA